MPRNPQRPPCSTLCYLEASRVQSPAGVLSNLDVLTPDGEPLGSIEGVVIDAPARRVRYLDVKTPGWLRHRRYLLEADQLAHLDPERGALRLRASTDDAAVDLDADALPRFSEDDLLAAMFASRAA